MSELRYSKWEDEFFISLAQYALVPLAHVVTTPSVGCVNTAALMIKPDKHILITHEQLMMVTGNREFNSCIGHDHSDRLLCRCVCLSLWIHEHLSLTCRSPPTHAPAWAAQSDYIGNEVYIAIIILVIGQQLLAAAGSLPSDSNPDVGKDVPCWNILKQHMKPCEIFHLFSSKHSIHTFCERQYRLSTGARENQITSDFLHWSDVMLISAFSSTLPLARPSYAKPSTIILYG